MICPICNLPLQKEIHPAAIYLCHSNNICNTIIGFSRRYNIIRFHAADLYLHDKTIFLTRNTIYIDKNYKAPVSIKTPIKQILKKHISLCNFQ